ncbi:unnamed protein product, partial [Amoebophrya sp. A25]|eukprot:GSA25T00016691001.1
MGLPSYEVTGRFPKKLLKKATSAAEALGATGADGVEHDDDDNSDEAGGKADNENDGLEGFVEEPTKKQLNAVGAQRVYDCLPGYFAVPHELADTPEQDTIVAWWRRGIADYKASLKAGEDFQKTLKLPSAATESLATLVGLTEQALSLVFGISEITAEEADLPNEDDDED